MERTHYNGELSIHDVNKQVVLIGWVSKVRNLGSLKFIDLRDRSGIIQIFIKEDFILPEIKNEYIIQVIGTISKKSVANPLLKTGEIEVIASNVKVISKAETPPIIIDDKTDALEETRLKYRYLDLRRPMMQQKLIMKSKIMSYWRRYLDDLGFIEIETPLLTRSTPEGARDYLVPSRIHHGLFYALPQSPQIYKQLLMISGLERYYQLARCFRDEDLRADRQPDFTQIDIEASFLSFDHLLGLLETGVVGMFKSLKDVDIATPIKKITYQTAMEVYGSDKPDLRFDLPIIDFSKVLPNSLEPFANASFIKGFIIKNSAHILTRKVLDEFNLELKKFNVKSLIKFTLTNGQLESSFNKFLNAKMIDELVSRYQLNEGDTILLTSGSTFKSFHFALGSIRNKLAKLFNYIDENTYSILWVYDFPLFEVTEDGHLTSTHHPFTRPVDEDLHLLDTSPALVRSYAYDLVINGYEAGGGSLRIYDKQLQHRLFTLLGLSEVDIKEKFGWFIDAFNYGTPPHGGIAFGLDRLTMILTKTDNIRDVIAFPKNLSGVAPLERSPSQVSSDQLIELAISIEEK